MKTHQFVEQLIANAQIVNGIKPLNYLRVAEFENEYYICDDDGEIWELIPKDWEKFTDMFLKLYYKDIQRSYQEGQFRLRQATKQLLGINI